jgi:hypothetical protein
MKLPGWTTRAFRPNADEYRANLEGLNVVFSAVLGFVLAAAEGYEPFAFASVLAASLGAVVAILYISASEHRIAYALFAAIYIAAMPSFALRIMAQPLPPKLQPTLAVWLLFAIALELSRVREKPGAP